LSGSPVGEVFGGGGGFGPVEKGGGIDGAEESGDPLLKRAILDGEEGEGGAGKGKKGNEGPFEEGRKRGGVKEEGDAGATSELEKLLEGHIANQAELIGTDVLGNRVLLKDVGGLHSIKFSL
jgi:hypothetical protein